MPRWARRLEQLVYCYSALVVISAFSQLWDAFNHLPVDDEWSVEWQTREAELLEWGMPHLQNCTVVPSIEATDEPESECNVVYSADAKMFAGLLTSMLSLARNLAKPHQCSIHLIVSDDDYNQAEEVVECFKRELAASPSIPVVLVHRMLPLPVDVRALDRATPARLYDRNVPQMYVRWYLHEYLPNASRAIWLDADTLVRADVAPLLRAASRATLAAVPGGRRLFWQTRLEDVMSAPHSAALYDGLNDEKWFNPGVLVINLDRWRSRNFTRPLESWLEHTRGYLGIQMALNLEFRGEAEALPWAWNLHSLGRARYPGPCLERALLLHAGAADRELFDAWECHSLLLGPARPYAPARRRCGALRPPPRPAGAGAPEGG